MTFVTRPPHAPLPWETWDWRAVKSLQSHYPSSSVNIGIYEPIAEFTLGVVMCQKPLVAR
jgi:hypothetical protein